MKVCIGSARSIGQQCVDWASQNLPEGWELSHDMNDCDVFISVLYDKILTPEYLSKHRCYNFHPGIIPGYRGSGAFSWAIINEERYTGITLHEIDPGIDTGPIIYKYEVTIHPTSTAESLYNLCMEALFRMFRDWFYVLLSGKYATYPNPGGPFYPRKLLDGMKDISRIVRAFTFTGKESAYFYNRYGTKIYVRY